MEDFHLSEKVRVVDNITVDPNRARLPGRWQGSQNTATIGVDNEDTILSER